MTDSLTFQQLIVHLRTHIIEVLPLPFYIFQSIQTYFTFSPLSNDAAMPKKRQQFDAEEKIWWKKQYDESRFSNRALFLQACRIGMDDRMGEWYKKITKRKTKVPADRTFTDWYSARYSAKIDSNRGSKKKKLLPAKFPQLDAMIYNYINRCGDLLGNYGLGISWSVVKQQAFVFASRLKDTGIMSQAEFDSFKASDGYFARLKRRKDLKLVKLQGEANTIVEEAYQELAAAFRADLNALMEEYGVDPTMVFNADQTGLYYRRFPCTTICSKDNASAMKVCN